jgi:hypothetical protein
MSWGGPEFVIAIIAIGTLGGVLRTWIHARHGLPIDDRASRRRNRRQGRDDAGAVEEVERLKAENFRLTDRLEASEDRLAVLERIVTDKSYNLASEIEALRNEPARLQDKGNVQ